MMLSTLAAAGLTKRNLKVLVWLRSGLNSGQMLRCGQIEAHETQPKTKHLLTESASRDSVRLSWVLVRQRSGTDFNYRYAVRQATFASEGW